MDSKKRQKYQKYNKEAVVAAVADVRDNHFSWRKASLNYNVPSQTIGDRINGRYGAAKQKIGLKMPRNPKKKLGSRKYKDYTDETLKIAVEEVKKGSSLRKIAEKFAISRFALTAAQKGKVNKCGRPPVLNSEEERRLLESISMAGEWGFPLTALDIRLIVKGYLDRCGRNEVRFKNNMPGVDFIDSFLKRNSKDLSKRLGQNIKRSRAAISRDIVNNYFNELEKTLKDVDPSMIVNYDETNMTDDPGRKQVIARRGSRHPERIVDSSNSSTSLMFSGSASGMLLPPYITYKAAHLYDSWTENGPAGSRLALPYFKKFDSDAKKVLIGDNLSSHISAHIIEECNKNNIKFVLLPSNSKHFTQPLDVAFFRPLKIKWRQTLTEWKEANRGSIPKDRFQRLLKKCLDALGEENISKNLKSGFKAAGIVPLDQNEILKRLPDGDATAVSEELNSSNNWTDSIKAFFEESRKRETEPLKQRKKRKLNVPAGKGIEGIEDTILINDDDAQPNRSNTPNTKTKENHSKLKTLKHNRKLANSNSFDDSDDHYSLRDSNSDMDPETFSDLESEIPVDLQLEETTYDEPPK
ncbi:uncharacterized protein LOC105847861 [Hydra vulgaris]|uniref:uncharacterized protein LOC105847861 n=1 Tax=Hydra vulgaris TaxID=6087 RepID=UPI0006412518|nr:uncharacterized protein LOC105847861 [Hydra vulgaris]